jgi:hypothetical protein
MFACEEGTADEPDDNKLDVYRRYSVRSKYEEEIKEAHPQQLIHVKHKYQTTRSASRKQLRNHSYTGSHPLPRQFGITK